ncbi:MAG: TldD/PmbA family protein [Methanoregulaceae archaeon]|nr:TldD/PmbA family protein [Methanoregulaceae archaeon]
MEGIRYYDIRHVTGEATHIDIDNGVVESAGTSFFDTAVIRALGPKGWGIVTVENYSTRGRKERDEMIASAARLAAITDEDVRLAEPSFAVLPVPPMKEDPRTVGLEEKTAILSTIERAAAGISGIRSTRANYSERAETVHFEDVTGTEFTYETCRSGFGVLAVASRNGVVQMGYEPLHSILGLNIRHQEEKGREAGERAVALLDAGTPKGGIMNAVLDQELAGVFAHEAVGHASEGDLVQEGSSVLAGRIGEKIGNPGLTIVDDPTLPEFGFEPVDAEGSRVARTEIIRKGVVNSYLHSRETLAAVGNGLSGHARAMPGEPPLVRMSNTFIENGDSAFDEIIGECRQGILLKGSRGGQVDPGRGVFQFNAEYGYLIVDGEIGSMVRDVSLSGEILQTLHGIALLGNDRKMSQGYCGKGGQSVPVSDGSPHVLLRDAVVGGSAAD